jgi:group I intron endonuclease
MENCGIYKITNTLNGHFYIGSACNLKARKRRHFNDLRKGIHHSQALQRAWDKYGENVFEFSLLQSCEPDELIKNEQLCLDGLLPAYNVCKMADSPAGRIPTEEHKQKLSNSLKGRKRGAMPDETKIKIGNAIRGKKLGARPLEVRKKIGVFAQTRERVQGRFV